MQHVFALNVYTYILSMFYYINVRKPGTNIVILVYTLYIRSIDLVEPYLASYITLS